MLQSTQVQFTQSELNSLLILANERLQMEQKNNIEHISPRVKRIWVRNCTAIISKTSMAIDHCLTADEPVIEIL